MWRLQIVSVFREPELRAEAETNRPHSPTVQQPFAESRSMSTRAVRDG
jgi:hypothetical protein